MENETNKGRVYCSGPLFCPEEIGGMTAIAEVLEKAGYDVFLPHRDGLEAYVMKLTNSPLNVDVFKSREIVAKAIFAVDVYQLVMTCAGFVFNMNGRTPDEGGVAETAIAYSVGKPIVIYKNDDRTAFNGQDNAMVSCLATRRTSDIKKIPKEIESAAKLLKKLGNFPYRGDNIPPLMRDTLKLGEKIWKAMSAIKSKNSSGKQPSELVRKIADICVSYDGVEEK